MPVLFNQDSVAAQPVAEGITRQTLLDKARIESDYILLYRWTIKRGAAASFSVPEKDFSWMQVLDGEGHLKGGTADDTLTPDHIVLLPPGFDGTFTAERDTEILHAQVPDGARFDENFKDNPPQYRCIDWTREPVLDSEHDERKRIYMVTPQLFGTKAFKGEMIIYPPHTIASNHHHEGAEHFQYCTAGSGTVYLNEEPHPMRAGDVLYNYEYERHYFANDGDDDFVFVEFFVPGECKTIWAPGAEVCAWLPTGKDAKGRDPVRHIKAHSSELVQSPEDV